jgi:hypothetical protein
MPNLNPLLIQDYAAALIEPVENCGTVITDKRFSEETDDLAALLYNQSGAPHGWIITWDEIPDQAEDGTCSVETTIRLILTFLYPFRNDSGGIKSEIEFKTAIFDVNEVLNANRDLGVSDIFRHTFLRSAAPFDVVVFQNGGDKMTHIAEFTLDVVVTNIY